MGMLDKVIENVKETPNDMMLGEKIGRFTISFHMKWLSMKCLKMKKNI